MFVGIFVSCNSHDTAATKSDTHVTDTQAPAAKVPVTTVEIDTRLQLIDSLIFVFYKDPYSKDSLRYSRFYTQYSSTDSSLVQALIDNTMLPFVKLEKVKPCRNEGKLWCYGGGKILQTIYFSTLAPACSHIYLIKDGFFYYSPLQESLLQVLKKLKPLSKAPAAA